MGDQVPAWRIVVNYTDDEEGQDIWPEDTVEHGTCQQWTLVHEQGNWAFPWVQQAKMPNKMAIVLIATRAVLLERAVTDALIQPEDT